MRTIVYLSILFTLTSCHQRTEKEKIDEAGNYLNGARDHFMVIDSLTKAMPSTFWDKSVIDHELSAAKTNLDKAISMTKSIKMGEDKKFLMRQCHMFSALYTVIRPDVSIMRNDKAMEAALSKYDQTSQ